MIGLLTLVVVVLGIIAIAQLVRVFELSSELRGDREENIPDGVNRTQSFMFLVWIVAFLSFYGYLIYEYSDEMLPPASSVHGEAIDSLMSLNMWVINIVFVITNIVLFFFAYKYYYRKDRKVEYFTHSNKLELIWTVIPAVFLAVIIVYGLTTWNKITDKAPEDSIVVELYSKQFDWTARYAGADGKLGFATVRKINGANFLGVDSTDNTSFDDIIVKGEFHLPVNKSVSFQFRSQDVIHSAYMPHFRAQMNTVPGMVTAFHFIPTKTTAQMRAELGNDKFDYILLCNKICGVSHYNMQMTIIVESEEEYNKWLSEQKPFIAQN